MVDLLEQGTAWLDGMRQTHLSRTVTYQRGVDSVDIAATLGTTTYEVADEAGVIVQAKATDFIVSAEALVLGAAITKPQVGDRIRVSSGTKVLIFEVLDLGGAGHYRPSDPHGKMLRIHAKQVDEETP
ncbi:MAG: hypothetical protein GXY83_36020 [Rhodopirellula sp.]|mgnify:CR=1 FL=1|nr:hypothetical protein [Rhodopirellula sp.]